MASRGLSHSDASRGDYVPLAEISPLALRFSYVWYPIFVALFASPLNVNESKKIDDPGWRLYLYLAGVFMGIGYLVAGLVIAICRPLNLGTSRCTVVKNFILHTASKEESLEAYVYILLIPIGAIMGLFHVLMLSVRYGQGCSLGNDKNITGCVMCQFAWLLIWSTWATEIQQMVRNLRHDNVDHDQPHAEARAQTLQFSLNLTHLSSGIIVSIIALRAGFLLSVKNDRDRFNEVYTGQTSVAC